MAKIKKRSISISISTELFQCLLFNSIWIFFHLIFESYVSSYIHKEITEIADVEPEHVELNQVMLIHGLNMNVIEPISELG